MNQGFEFAILEAIFATSDFRAQRRRRVEKVAPGREPWEDREVVTSPGGAAQIFSPNTTIELSVPRLRRSTHLSTVPPLTRWATLSARLRRCCRLDPNGMNRPVVLKIATGPKRERYR